jgi:hypothetical protein
MVFDTRPEGARKFGRAKLRWEDGVIQDVSTLAVRNWRNVDMHREDWLKPLKKPGSIQDCRADDDDDDDDDEFPGSFSNVQRKNIL